MPTRTLQTRCDARLGRQPSVNGGLPAKRGAAQDLQGLDPARRAAWIAAISRAHIALWRNRMRVLFARIETRIGGGGKELQCPKRLWTLSVLPLYIEYADSEFE